MRKGKPKSAGPKHGKKKAVRIKDLPVKNGREILGGSAAPNLTAQEREALERATLINARPPNLGL